MKNLIKYLLVMFACLACSNEFLDENTNPVLMPAGDSELYLAPGHEAADYRFVLPQAVTGDFTVIKAPEWLQLTSTTGKLLLGRGSVNCSARNNPAFGATGLYMDRMIVLADAKEYNIPVVYVNEGTPHIETPASIDFAYDGVYPTLNIVNTGEGILIWDIVSKPAWLDILIYDNANLLLMQDYMADLYLNIVPEEILTPDTQTGEIVIVSNDRNNPMVTVPVSFSLGKPTLDINYEELKLLDFGESLNELEISFGNWSYGLILWHLDDLPEWLAASATSGYITSGGDETITLTCNRELLQPGVNTATLHLVSNDAGNPSHDITVKAQR